MTRARDKANSTVTNFASTGIDDNADANAITIDSSENVLVGKTAQGTANDGLQVKPAGELAVTRDGNHTLILNRKSSDGDIALLQKDGSTIGSIKAQNGTDISIGSVNTELRFFDSADQIIPTTDNLTTLGRSDSRFKDLYLSGGAYIGGTGSANYLDDYEEGTWTPSIATGTISYGQQEGTYTKVGDTVHLAFNISVNTTSGGSGNLFITGMPFNFNGSSPWPTGSFTATSFSYARHELTALSRIDNNAIGILSSNGSWGWELRSAVNNNFAIRGAITYRTSA